MSMFLSNKGPQEVLYVPANNLLYANKVMRGSSGEGKYNIGQRD